MTDEARSTPELEAADAERERPPGLPDAKSAARLRTPVPDEAPRQSLRPRREGEPASAAQEAAEPRPPGLKNMTTSARLRLQLVLEQDEDDDRPRISTPPAPDPKKPPSLPRQRVVFDADELRAVRSLGRWIAFCGLMTLTVGALTGLSYVTGEGNVAHVVVGILASALAVWLLAAAVSFHRAAAPERDVRHQLVNGFAQLRSALLLKAILLFAGMVLGCITFSLAASLLFLL